MSVYERLEQPTWDAKNHSTWESMQLQLEVQIREFTRQSYKGWIVYDDSMCGNHTHIMSVYGRKYLKLECKGKLTQLSPTLTFPKKKQAHMKLPRPSCFINFIGLYQPGGVMDSTLIQVNGFS